MNRLLACGLLAALAIDAPTSLMAENPSRSAELRLFGKAVVFEQEGKPSRVKVDVRFATIGEHGYIIVSHPPSDAKQWDEWISLDEIHDFKVFDSVDEAFDYIETKNPQSPQIASSVLKSPLKPFGKKGTPSIAGTVTYRGQPVTGRILFHTSEGTFFGSRISNDGKYAFPNPPQGEFTVTVEGPNVPEQYSNQESKLRVIINKGSNTIDLDL